MTQDQDSHISIAMPDGTTCRAFVPFEVYASNDDGGEIVRLNYEVLGSVFLIVSAHKDPTGTAAEIVNSMPQFTTKPRQTLTDLPHSPERTLMRSID